MTPTLFGGARDDASLHTGRHDVSVEQIAAVLNHEADGLAGTRKLVLLGIANHAAPDGTDAWPGVDTLARYAGVSRRNVQKALQWLDDAGLIAVEHNRGGTHDTPDRYRPNRYRITLDGGPGSGMSETTPLGGSGVSETTRRGVACDASGVSETTPEPSVEPSTNHPRASGLAWTPSQAAIDGGQLEAATDLCLLLAEQLRERGVRVPDGRPRTKAWIEPMEQLLRLDGKSPDDVRRVLCWLHAGHDRVSAFWRGNVLSPNKVRERWDQMAQQYAREAGPRPSRGAAIAHASGSGRSLAEIMADDDNGGRLALDSPDPDALEA